MFSFVMFLLVCLVGLFFYASYFWQVSLKYDYIKFNKTNIFLLISSIIYILIKILRCFYTKLCYYLNLEFIKLKRTRIYT